MLKTKVVASAVIFYRTGQMKKKRGFQAVQGVMDYFVY